MPRLNEAFAANVTPPERGRTSSRWALGRPKKAAPELRARRVNFRVDDAELTALRSRAKAAGLSLSEFARVQVTGHAASKASARAAVLESPEAFALRQEIGRVGVNLNQITRRLHTTGEHEPAELRDVCATLNLLMRRILADNE
jgi:hypothetical protein